MLSCMRIPACSRSLKRRGGTPTDALPDHMVSEKYGRPSTGGGMGTIATLSSSAADTDDTRCAGVGIGGTCGYMCMHGKSAPAQRWMNPPLSPNTIASPVGEKSALMSRSPSASTW